ncbi:hypothetical protein GCM10007320_66650 [Pseudorhodoferax aquiterrae]|uniref:Uncharacterized protein n=2 Tax=Pseudorhodoferax aquiterrae TaxID=747304 RepID=A0ABQ3GIP6_9BURK|nr:hypothetical protein GCM10007320_66650 [Pseudorhodoferax aquiterrae]
MEGRPYWLVVDYRIRAWARDVLVDLARLERAGLLQSNDPWVRTFLTGMVDGTCDMVSKSKWLFCLEGLDEMRGVTVPAQRRAAA